MVRMRTRVGGLLLALAASALPASAWYLPGSAPRSYGAGDEVPFGVNSIQPKAQAEKEGVHGLVAYDYYDPRFHFCRPRGEPQAASEGLGSALFGDRIYNSPLQAHMLKNETCAKLCDLVFPLQDMRFVNDRIKEGYASRWLVDGLPVAQQQILESTHELYYSIGFPLGAVRSIADEPLDPPALYNHFDIYLDYHQRRPNEYRVVGASVWPYSRQTISGGSNEINCNAADPVRLDPSSKSGIPVAYTYNTYWRESSTPWATRWDHYLKIDAPRIHWFSLLNGIVLAAGPCMMVIAILYRSTNRDINRYQMIDLSEDVQEESGWKLVHGEVFRSPSSPSLLSVMLGSGAQLAAMATVTLFFAAVGFLSPSRRGSLGVSMIMNWMVFGILAGYFSTRMYTSLGGDRWKRNVFFTATLFPCLIFATINFLNFFLLISRSSGAVPFGALLALVAIWFLVNVPLTLLGSWLGLRAGGFRTTARVNTIPRQIPPVPWYLHTYPAAILGGFFPFAAALLEIYMVMSSLFGTKIYYAFGFMALTFLVSALTTAAVAVLLCYFSLSHEDYRWHWRAFAIGGGSAFWLFLYGMVYWASSLSLPGLANKVIYLGYLSLICLVDFLLFGPVGYAACYLYIRHIYAAIRID